MIGLSHGQEVVYQYLVSFIDRHGFPPTRIEIANALGFRSANAAEEHLQAIQRKGHIKILNGVSRGIQVLKSGHGTLATDCYDDVKMIRILRQIQAWAKFDIAENCTKMLDPNEVLKLCGDALRKVT